MLIPALYRRSGAHDLKLLSVLGRNLNDAGGVFGSNTLFILAVLRDTTAFRNGQSALTNLAPIEIDVRLRTGPNGRQRATISMRACKEGHIHFLSGRELGGRLHTTISHRLLMPRFI